LTLIERLQRRQRQQRPHHGAKRDDKVHRQLRAKGGTRKVSHKNVNSGFMLVKSVIKMRVHKEPLSRIKRRSGPSGIRTWDYLEISPSSSDSAIHYAFSHTFTKAGGFFGPGFFWNCTYAYMGTLTLK
jgi:hypothetical protein